MFVIVGDQAVNLTRAAAIRVLPASGDHPEWAIAAIFSARVVLLERCGTEAEAREAFGRYVELANQAGEAV